VFTIKNAPINSLTYFVDQTAPSPPSPPTPPPPEGTNPPKEAECEIEQ